MTAYPTPPLRGLIASAAAIVVAAALLVATPVSASTTASVATSGVGAAVQSASGSPSVDSSIRKAADMSQFRPGNIISDAVFFDRSTMNSGQIQAFLDSKVSVCRSSYACLKTYSQHTPNKAADAYCNGYSAGRSELASLIIAKVAQSCGINPQVLLTMLEKEQSLVTYAYPAPGRFTAAMGQGCPDTAGCDPAYAGFFYQVYGAARQMKIYAEGKWFTYYAPGKTWNIRYNPSVSCGSAPVFVENTATAALYYYTPYQPNRAALNDQYGLGDSCSAHGNRNFFRIFSDWFGSTQGPSSNLIRSSTTGEVFLVSAGTKHYVTNAADLSVLTVRVGSVLTVSPNYVASLPTGNRFIRLVRDARNGAVYLFQPDGTKHHFQTTALITRYGMSTEDYTPLSPLILDAYPTGRPVGDYFRSEDSGDYFKWENGQRRHIANQLAWQLERAKAKDYVAVFPAGNAAFPPVGRALLAPGTLVKEKSRDEVFIVGNGSELTHIPSWELSADAGITAYQPVANGTFAGYDRSSALAPLFTCGAKAYVVDGGKVSALASAAKTGAGPTLPASVCAVLPRTGKTLPDPVFVKSASSDPIYSLEKGTIRHVQSQQRLLEISGGKSPYTATWSNATIAAYAKGAPYLAEGSFVSFAGRGEVYRYTGKVLQHVQDWATLLRLGGGAVPPIQTLPESFRGSFTFGS
ncbi:hypothetical protein [Microbacterium sp. 1.5R]|uniref:hypothetical protein n=1 Tax=Microbacterium sp. 1.5R TaxID=1916917 RepID=UPI00119D7279|nr:hypothetical protein [Microbacterium sp. 1.5R]